MQHSSPARSVIRILGAVAVVLLAAALSPARAVSVSPGQVLPLAVSYEYVGLNFANNIRTNNTLGSLVYNGLPGCGGVCVVTTALGASPFVVADINEVDAGASGGVVEGHLGYYVAYLNAPGDYTVNLHAIETLSAPDGAAISAHLKFGPADSTPGSFNDFASTTFEEAACINRCPAPGFAIATAPFVADNLVTMTANTLYFMQLDLLMNPGPSNVAIRGLIDPTFSTSAAGGTFVFSVQPAPIPAALPLFASGLGGLGIVRWRRKHRRT
jgi:hypothetical protein